MDACLNEADWLEALLNKNGFVTWGFVTCRRTNQSNFDWEKSLSRFLSAVPGYLEVYRELDLLDTFAPTVLEDPFFEGATIATLREDFNQWVKTSFKKYQGGPKRLIHEAMESVLSAPKEDYKTGFVRMVHAEREPEVLDEDNTASGDVSESEEPLEGCTENDVGWVKVCWGYVELPGFHKLPDWEDW
ncbi:hypothetical protein N7523_006890 [Penicillium sp. IBT 18751x]|nr:hypothetical protein N7523_006890 [Penicillium sp. IBT 18751x]